MALYWMGWTVLIVAYVVLMLYVLIEEYPEQYRRLQRRAEAILQPIRDKIEHIRVPAAGVLPEKATPAAVPESEPKYKFERAGDGRLVKVLDDEGEEVLSDSDRLPIGRLVGRNS